MINKSILDQILSHLVKLVKRSDFSNIEVVHLQNIAYHILEQYQCFLSIERVDPTRYEIFSGNRIMQGQHFHA